jgi:hypothetical protein
MGKLCIHDINRLRIVFIHFIAHIEPLIVDVSMPFPSVHDAVAGAPAEPELFLGGKRVIF